MTSQHTKAWPELPYSQWSDTCATLHLWTQIVGKIRLSLTPWLNHGWHVPLYVNASGLTTSVIPYESRAFEIEFNFIDHTLDIQVSDGGKHRIDLEPQSVAAFHRKVMTALRDLGIAVTITNRPCEIANAIPFTEDRAHASYDAAHAHRFWRVLLGADRVLKQFRTGFRGKCSPVHFFWGSFDLAVTRFSGRPAPLFQGKTPGLAARIMQEAYSHEVSSAGFWPGGNGLTEAAFYSYAYPEPPGYRTAHINPPQAYFNETLGEFLLPYAAVSTAKDPDATLLAFLQTTYEAAADRAGWDRAALDGPLGTLGFPK